MNQESLSISFSSIEVNEEFNVRTMYSDIEELAQSIKAQGLITPLTVMRNGGDKFKLVSGFRRWNALKSLKTGNNPVNVVIRTFESDGQLHLANLVENTARAEIHPADLAARLAELESGTYRRVLSPIKEGEAVTTGEKLARKEIANQTGLSTQHIGNLIRCHQKTCDALKKLWRKHEIPMARVFKWSVLDEEAQLEAFAEWKEQQDLEKEEGKKRKKKGEEEEETVIDVDSDEELEEGEAEEVETTPSGPSKSEIRHQLKSRQEKIESGKLKGPELEVEKTKVKVLRWILGEITRL